MRDTNEFKRNPGGAPANVCVQVAKNGFNVSYVSKVGNDGFGDYLIETLEKQNVDTSFITKSEKYLTSLAFVSFLPDGDREFSFYRNGAADLHFKDTDVVNINIDLNDIFHFGSVALSTKKAREAHNILLKKASNSLVTFDPNLRFNLWSSKSELKKIVREYIPYASVLKISDDELFFITNIENELLAIQSLFIGEVKIILLTKGARGASLYTKDGRMYNHSGYRVNCIDTTGAGDSFFGGFISKLLENNITKENLLSDKINYNNFLDFSCKCGAFTTTKFGAISAMGNKEEVEMMVK